MMAEAHADARVPARRRFWAARVFALGAVGFFFMSGSAWHTDDGVASHLVMQFGIVLAAIGAFGRLWASSYAVGNKSRMLVQVGPYSLTRNPLYFFSYVGGLGVMITTETVTLPVLFSIWYLWYYARVIQGEEFFLSGQFGLRFWRYTRAVPRFVPSATTRRGYLEPTSWKMSPASFRGALVPSLWFVVGAVAVHAIHDLRLALDAGAYLTLY